MCVIHITEISLHYPDSSTYYSSTVQKSVSTGRILSIDECETLSTNMILYESVMLFLLPPECVIE